MECLNSSAQICDLKKKTFLKYVMIHESRSFQSDYCSIFLRKWKEIGKNKNTFQNALYDTFL